ncbi:MAG: hypothetical protein QM764_11245 [Chitinophagaceae bacterium]
MRNSRIKYTARLIGLVCTGFFLFKSSFAQVFIETYPPVSTNTDMIKISGLNTLSDGVPYEKISGSAYYNDEWQLASLFGSGKNEKWLCKIKLNLATGELHYLGKNGDELVTYDGAVKKIVIHKDNDTSKVSAVFILTQEPVKLNQALRNTYLQVLNSGSYELLKLSKRNLNSADSLFGTLKRYFFKDESDYFVYHSEMINGLKRLDKESLLQLLPGSSAFADWVKENRINFRKEDDALAFMNYYNSKK